MISKEEKKIILRRKPLPSYYISLKDMFPSIYQFIKRDLFRKLKANEDVTEDVIYDYRLDNIWLSKKYFNKYSDIFIGYIQNETLNKYQAIIEAQDELAIHLYNQYVYIRSLSTKELNTKIKKYRHSEDENYKRLYEYCYYDRISRFLPVQFINRCIYVLKFVPRHIYQEEGRQKILES